MATFPPQPQKLPNLKSAMASAPIELPAEDVLEISQVTEDAEPSENFDLMPPDPDAKGPYITYTGMATLREITKRDWQKIGVVDQGDVQWNLMNGYRIPVSNLSESAIDYCLRVDGRFSKVDE